MVKSKLAPRSESAVLGTLNPFHKKGPKSPSFFYNGNTISYFAKMPRCQIIMLKYFMNALFLWKQDSKFSTIIYTKRLSRDVKLCLKLWIRLTLDSCQKSFVIIYVPTEKCKMIGIFKTLYLRMDQIKFVDDSL